MCSVGMAVSPMKAGSLRGGRGSLGSQERVLRKDRRREFYTFLREAKILQTGLLTGQGSAADCTRLGILGRKALCPIKGIIIPLSFKIDLPSRGPLARYLTGQSGLPLGVCSSLQC